MPKPLLGTAAKKYRLCVGLLDYDRRLHTQRQGGRLLDNYKKRQSLPLLCSPRRISRKGTWHCKRDGTLRGRGGDVWNVAGRGVGAKLDRVVRAVANHHPKIVCVCAIKAC